MGWNHPSEFTNARRAALELTPEQRDNLTWDQCYPFVVMDTLNLAHWQGLKLSGRTPWAAIRDLHGFYDLEWKCPTCGIVVTHSIADASMENIPANLDTIIESTHRRYCERDNKPVCEIKRRQIFKLVIPLTLTNLYVPSEDFWYVRECNNGKFQNRNEMVKPGEWPELFDTRDDAEQWIKTT
jgi:hypothetical protein